MENRKIIFFDAECLVCNRLARFVLLRSAELFLAPLNGTTWQALQLPAQFQGVDSIVFWNGQRAFLRVEAMREIARHLGIFWQELALLSRLLPLRLLNYFYDRFASMRYRWFGRVERCALIPEAFRRQLLA